MKTLINHIQQAVRQILQDKILTIFSVALVVMLFLGDGKYTYVDLVSYAGTFCLAFWVAVSRRRFESLPKQIFLFWVATLLYFFVHIFFSGSAEYSLQIFLRYAVAFVLFATFFGVGISERSLEVALLGFAIFSVFTAFCGLFTPALKHVLPGMNLIYLVYGHNALAYILVYIAPLVLRPAVQRLSPMRLGALLVYCAIVFFTFARGVWLLFSIYFVYVQITRTGVREPLKRPILAIIACLFFIGTIFPFGNYITSKRLAGAYIPKKENLSESRVKYWEQAWRGFTSSPIVGTGPGTFYFQSLKYQKSADSNSWFAHNYFLQTLSETGVVGAIILLGTFTVILKEVFKRRNQAGQVIPLIEGAMLTMGLGLYSTNLDFIIIWMMFWASLGAVLGRAKNIGVQASANRDSGFQQRFFYSVSGILLFCYFASVLAIGIKIIFPSSQVTVYTSVLNSEAAIGVINQQGQIPSISKSWLKIAVVIHNNNPVVMRALAKYYIREGQLGMARKMAEGSMMVDPKNIASHAIYTEVLEALGLRRGFIEDAQLLSSKFLSEKDRDNVSQGLLWYAPRLSRELSNKRINYDAYTSSQVSEVLARLFYIFGDSLQNDNPEGVLYWWRLAAKADPGVSYYWADLARYLSIIGRSQESMQALTTCQKYKDAKHHCDVLVGMLLRGDPLRPSLNADMVLGSLRLSEIKSK